MKTYLITNTVSGHTLGEYPGNSADEALLAMAIDAGYRSVEHMDEVTDGDHGDLEVVAVVRGRMVDEDGDAVGVDAQPGEGDSYYYIDRQTGRIAVTVGGPGGAEMLCDAADVPDVVRGALYGVLMDSDTNAEIGPATGEQRQASLEAGAEGHIVIDEDGEVIPASERDAAVRHRGATLRRVYVQE